MTQSDYPRGAPFDVLAERRSRNRRIGVLLGQRDLQEQLLDDARAAGNGAAIDGALDNVAGLTASIRQERRARDTFEQRVSDQEAADA